MATFLSPAVFVNEIDLSALPNNASGIVPAFVGTAKKGLLNKPILVTTAQQFIDNFGDPFAESFLGYAVLAYLEEGNLCWVLRAGVEAEAGQPDALADIAIDVSGARHAGWGRIPVFKGIDYGRIKTRAAGDSGWTFHNKSATFLDFNDSIVSVTDGATAAILTLTGTAYTGAIDDSFLVLITSAPSATSGSVLDGAGYTVIRSSDGAEVDSGNLVESGTLGTSNAVTLPDSVVFKVVVSAGTLDVNDSFRFSVAPDNRHFSLRVDNEAIGGVNSFTMPAAAHATVTDLVTALNVVIGSGEPYIAVENADGTATFRTRTAGEMIQLVSTEAFALEVGQSLYAYDIPRSNLLSTDTGPYDISSANNSVTLQVRGKKTVEVNATIPVGFGLTATTIAQGLNSAATVLGDTLYSSFAMTIPGGDEVLIIQTTQAHELEQIFMEANGSHIKTLRFAQQLDILYPYTEAYRGYSSDILTLPEGGAITEDSPLSCELDPLSAQCALDSAYYENIIGFFVAVSPGTWITDYKLNLEHFTGSVDGRFTVRISDKNGIVQGRVDDVSFNPSDARYIGSVINPGTPIGGLNGNEFINWERRPLFLGDDPTDTANFEVRLPAPFFNRPFGGQANGIPNDAIYSSELDRAVIGNPALNTGLYQFANPERFDISLLVVPGFSSGAVIVSALSICTQRGDCLYIVDPPFGLNSQQVVDWHNGLLFTDLAVALDSSYGALYHPWVKIFDQFNGGNIFVPPSGHVAAIFARTDRVAEIWFAPAGLNRGKLITALDLEYEHTRGERDLMYGFNNAVNPLVKIPQRGIHIWGQRTLQRKDSALDRVNVRMLLIAIKKALAGPSGSLNEFLFEPNDRITRQLVKSQIDNYMSDVAARRGVQAWSTICDESNNTPIRIDRNELWIALLIKPTRAIEFIVLNIGIMRTDQSFVSQEVLAAVGVTSAA